jgi:hypothetical protein
MIDLIMYLWLAGIITTIVCLFWSLNKHLNAILGLDKNKN